MTPRSLSRHRSGFTLLELLVVLVVFAITAAAAVPAFLGEFSATPEQQTARALVEVLTRAWRFRPDGPATPLAITVQGARAVAVRVDGWNGGIAIGDARKP